MPALIFALWMILNGRITVEIVLIGLGVTALVTWFAIKVIGYSWKTDWFVLINLPVFLLYILDLIWEIIKAAWMVMTMVYRADDPDPVIVEFHSGFTTDLQNVLLANSITLTPGTITVFQEKDHFVIHCLRREYAKGITNSSFIRLLGKLKLTKEAQS